MVEDIRISIGDNPQLHEPWGARQNFSIPVTEEEFLGLSRAPSSGQSQQQSGTSDASAALVSTGSTQLDVHIEHQAQGLPKTHREGKNFAQVSPR